MNEFNLPKLTGALSMTRLRNRLKQLDPELVCHLKNIRVNGQLQGCSGFVVNPRNQQVAYVNTDANHGSRLDEAFYRTAENVHDYRGGRNHHCRYHELPRELVEFLR